MRQIGGQAEHQSPVPVPLCQFLRRRPAAARTAIFQLNPPGKPAFQLRCGQAESDPERSAFAQHRHRRQHPPVPFGPQRLQGVGGGLLGVCAIAHGR
ncbi:MAG: hypothetical protein C0605_07590, partial [Hyphomicrobiales bacterium]